MKGVSKALTKEDIEEASKRDDTVVMEPSYDNIFTPWSAEDVGAMVDSLRTFTLEHATLSTAEVKKLANSSGDFDEFARLFPTFYTKFCTPSFVSNDEHMNLVKSMLITHHNVQRGHLSRADADKKISGDTLASLYKQAQQAQREEDD